MTPTTKSTRLAIALGLSLFFRMTAGTAAAQTLSLAIDQTVGGSTEEITATATDLRAFGELTPAIRFKVEAAWAARSSDEGDALHGAYPYGDGVQLMEAYGEHLFAPGRGVLAVRGGHYRTPFGIYSGSDHAYLGFLRAPLVRYDSYYALSNDFLEYGADVVVGVPRLSLEASVGVPGDVTDAPRRSGLDTVLRAQGVFGSFILGMSHIRTQPNWPATFAFGMAEFSGIDARWMRGGVQFRGEWIWGQPFDGTRTVGGYLDAIVHRPAMGPVTAVARAERLAYDARAPFAFTATRLTVGGRLRLLDRLSVELDLVRQSRVLVARSPLALDAALTYSLRHDVRR